jgi:uncharacterized protein YaiL (DUF2058 family)
MKNNDQERISTIKANGHTKHALSAQEEILLESEQLTVSNSHIEVNLLYYNLCQKIKENIKA